MTQPTKALVLDGRKFFGKFSDIPYMLKCRDGSESRWDWPKKYGDGYMSFMKIRSGLVLSLSHFYLHETIKVVYDEIEMPITFGVCLEGDPELEVRYHVNSSSFMSIETGIGFINYGPERQVSSTCPTGRSVRVAVVYIDPSVLGELLTGQRYLFTPALRMLAEGDRTVSCYEQFAATPVIKSAIFQIMNCPYQGVVKRIFMESKALELIAHSLGQLSRESCLPDKNHGLRLSELKAVRNASEILIANMEQPPPLPDLALRVGINIDKLNFGFQQVFGTTPFNFLRINRMERARMLLESREKNVSEVAFEVGYLHPKNFARAYKNYFGFNPSEHLRYK